MIAALQVFCLLGLSRIRTRDLVNNAWYDSYLADTSEGMFLPEMDAYIMTAVTHTQICPISLGTVVGTFLVHIRSEEHTSELQSR